MARLSLLTETFPPEVNGVSFTLARLARGLTQLGDQVEVICPERTSTNNLDENWSEFYIPSRKIPGYDDLRFGLLCKILLINHWRNNPPALVYLATEGPAGYSALRACLQLGIPCVSGFHTNFDQYLKHYRLPFLKPLVDRYLVWFHNKTKVTFAPTHWMVDLLESKGYHNLVVFGRGVERDLFSPERRCMNLRKIHGVRQDERILITVGRVAAEKNLDLTCEIFEQNMALGLAKAAWVVGDGPEMERLRRKYPKVHFTGCLDKDELARHYASADLFVFASETETFGNVVTEALGAGLPVVSYDYAAPGQYVIEGKNGSLITLGNAVGLKTAVSEILKTPNAAFKEMKSFARQSTESLDWESILRGLRGEFINVSNDFKKNTGGFSQEFSTEEKKSNA